MTPPVDSKGAEISETAKLRDNFDKSMESLYEKGVELLKEAGLYDDFLEWQKKHGVAAPRKANK